MRFLEDDWGIEEAGGMDSEAWIGWIGDMCPVQEKRLGKRQGFSGTDRASTFQ